MFWNRAKAPESRPVAPAVTLQEVAGPTSVDRPVSTDTALDAVGALLRAMGKFAFDTDESLAIVVSHRLERWAQHVTIGGRHPDDAPEQPGRRGRDFAGMQREIVEHRKLEQRFVNETVGELRQLVWTFIRSVHRAIATEQDADERAKRQLSRLHAAAVGPSIEELKREALSAVTTLDDVLRERAKRQRDQMTELGERLRTLGRQLEEARRDGELDPLTKVGNRRAFDERIERVGELSGLCGSSSCLIFVDIDHFKAVNDGHGHQVGDMVLARVADALSRAFLRKSDFVARYGGEEFAIILHEVSMEASRKLTARLIERVRGLELDDLVPGLKVSVSVGVAELAPREAHAGWLERADKALYEAKHRGRNCIVEAPPPDPTPRPA